jgi:hypothetical protein
MKTKKMKKTRMRMKMRTKTKKMMKTRMRMKMRTKTKTKVI